MAPCPGQEWARAYGGAGWEELYSIRQTFDGGYIATGWTDSFGAGQYDAWVIKLDTGGNLQWQKTYGSPGGVGHSVIQVPDGGYVVAGDTSTDVWILRLDALGGVMWQETIGGSGKDEAWGGVQPTADGGFAVAGNTALGGGGFWVLKLDAAGALQWDRVYSLNPDSNAFAITQLSDGGYVVVGQVWMANGYNGWVLRLDANGSVVWQTLLGGASRFRSVVTAADGGFLVAGRFGSKHGVAKLSSSGTVQWAKMYGSEQANSIQPTADGGFVVTGFLSSSRKIGAGGWDIFVLKIDANGNALWQKTYGGSGSELASAVQQTSDGGYIVAGRTSTYGVGTDAWILKLDSGGNLVMGCPTGLGKSVTPSVANAQAQASVPGFSSATSGATVAASSALASDSTAGTLTQCTS